MPDAQQNVAQSRGFLKKYVFSADHKVIGLQYYFLALFAVLVALVLSWVMRMHLAWPNLPIPFLAKLSPAGAPGGLITPEYYLSLLTIHGTLMIFFVLTVALQFGFGSFLLPLQIGAKEMAFPRLNMLSFWMTFGALGVLLSTFFVSDGPPTAGWTAYPPLSGVGPIAGPGEGMGQNLWIIAIVLFCLAALIGSVNFVATILALRARGMTMMRLPLPCWAWFLTAVLMILSFPVLVGACTLLMLDRVAGTTFFVPSGLNISGFLLQQRGGSPLLWQHMFWFFGHPEVYITILPAMAVISHIISCFSRKPVFGYRAMVYSQMAIGIMSFAVWGHHMFTSGMNPYTGFAFAVLTMAIAVPSAVKTFNWMGTMWRGRLRLDTPMLFAIGFVSVFVTGGLSGLFLAQPPLDVYLHATYFVVAHFHIVMGMAVIFAIFAATYFWFPKMFGRLMNERLGKIHFWCTFVGAYATFMPMHFLGLEGNPRRYSALTDYFLRPLIPLHQFITVAALLVGLAQFLFIFNFFWSLFMGPRASDNPWEATSLEWTTSSPPPPGNFVWSAPRIYRGAYEYSVPGSLRDFVMQDSPEAEGDIPEMMRPC